MWGELEYVTRVGHEERGNWEGKIGGAWKLIEGKENAAVAGVSVVPADGAGRADVI